MLEISHLHTVYGAVVALNDVSMRVGEGEFVSIVGPNGAGKTTLFKTISGTVIEKSGAVTFEGKNILSIPPHERPHLGIAHVPEGRQVFPNLTVEENLELGAFTQAGRRDWQSNLSYIFELFPILAERRLQLAGTLSGGQQQMLAIGRGLASSPKLLMLDEPSMGLAPTVADSIFEAIVQIWRNRKWTVRGVEQGARAALDSCARGFVIEPGRVVLEGTPAELTADERVRQAYLGI